MSQKGGLNLNMLSSINQRRPPLADRLVDRLVDH